MLIFRMIMNFCKIFQMKIQTDDSVTQLHKQIDWWIIIFHKTKNRWISKQRGPIRRWIILRRNYRCRLLPSCQFTVAIRCYTRSFVPRRAALSNPGGSKIVLGSTEERVSRMQYFRVFGEWLEKLSSIALQMPCPLTPG